MEKLEDINKIMRFITRNKTCLMVHVHDSNYCKEKRPNVYIGLVACYIKIQAAKT